MRVKEDVGGSASPTVDVPKDLYLYFFFTFGHKNRVPLFNIFPILIFRMTQAYDSAIIPPILMKFCSIIL